MSKLREKNPMDEVDQNGLTGIQRKMLRILSDGEQHSRQELHGCLSDELSDLSAIRTHLYVLRGFLKPKGFIILCVLPGGKKGTIPHYQLARHLHSPQE